MDPFVDSLGRTHSSSANGKSSSSSKTLWSSLGTLSSCLQILLGVLLFIVSTVYLMHTGRSSGQLIGILSVTFGFIGLTGLRLKGNSLQLLFIVGMGFIAMLTFEFTVQMGRDIEIHCTLAESYTRLSHLETTLTSMKNDELVSQLFSRLNEMDDMLDMVQSGSVEKLDAKWGDKNLLEQDTEFISAKLESLKNHAEKALDQIISESNSRNQTTDNRKQNRKQKEIEAALLQRIEKMEELLDVIKSKEDRNESMKYEEFEALFHAIAGIHSNPEVMEKDWSELPLLKGALQRTESNTNKPTSNDDQTKALEKHREDQRARFESTFHSIMSENYGSNARVFHNGLVAAMEDLPEHCLMESDHFDYFLYGGWLLIASQMAAAYISATSLFVENFKKDY